MDYQQIVFYGARPLWQFAMVLASLQFGALAGARQGM
jgi:hypothetical protein